MINHPCTVCCKPTSMWCSRCQATWYCTPEHLQADWPRHRKVCIPVNHAQGYNIITTPPPVEQKLITVSAILFAPEEDRPRIIMVKCRPTRVSSQGICPQPLVNEHFPDGQMESIVLTQGQNEESLQFPLHLWYSPAALVGGSPVNHAVYHITSSAVEKHWCGAVVVLKFSGLHRQGYSDAGSNDLPALSAYFAGYSPELDHFRPRMYFGL